MQFHIEITPQKIAGWMANPGEAHAALVQRQLDSVQSPPMVAEGSLAHQAGSEVLARWIDEAWRSRWSV